jgi:nicotinamidase-related amidase
MLLEAKSCQLILIDHQERLMPAIADGAAVLRKAQLLAGAAKALQVPIIGTEQNPAKLGPLAPALRALCGPVMPKMSFSACRDGLVDLIDEASGGKAAAPKGNARSLPKHLQKAVPASDARTTLVLAGCEAHVCLLQTAMDLIETEEFEIYIVTDACGSRSNTDRDAAFDRLAGAGAELVTAEMVAFEWLESADHPQFRNVHALIK